MATLELFLKLFSPWEPPVISSEKLPALAEECASTNLMKKPVLILYVCRYIDDLPIPRAMSGPIERLPLDAELIRQHMLRFGVFGWRHYVQSLVNKGLSLAHDYLKESLSLMVVFFGVFAALYLCLHGRSLHKTEEVGRDDTGIAYVGEHTLQYARLSRGEVVVYDKAIPHNISSVISNS